MMIVLAIPVQLVWIQLRVVTVMLVRLRLAGEVFIQDAGCVGEGQGEGATSKI